MGMGLGSKCEACSLTCEHSLESIHHGKGTKQLNQQKNLAKYINQLLSLASSLLALRVHERSSRGVRDGGYGRSNT